MATLYVYGWSVLSLSRTSLYAFLIEKRESVAQFTHNFGLNKSKQYVALKNNTRSEFGYFLRPSQL